MSQESTQNVLVYLLKQQEAKTIAAQHMLAQEREKLRQAMSLTENLLKLSGPLTLAQLGTSGGSAVFGNLELVIPLGDLAALQRTGLAVELSPIELLEVTQIPQGALYSVRLSLRDTAASIGSVRARVTLLPWAEGSWAKLLQWFWGITPQSAPGTYECRAHTADEIARLGRLMDEYTDAVDGETSAAQVHALSARLDRGDF